MSAKDIGDLLAEDYLARQREAGKLFPMSHYAEILGVRQQNLWNWMRKRSKPRKEADIKKLADKLGPRVYDALGLIPYPPEIEAALVDLARAIQLWPESLRPMVREVMVETAEQLVRLKITDEAGAMEILRTNLLIRLGDRRRVM